MQINGAVKFWSKRDADPDLPLLGDFLDPAEAGHRICQLSST